MKIKFRLIILIVVLIALSSCRKDKATELDNTIIAQIISEPRSLHPTNGRTSSRAIILWYTNQHLTRLDPETLEVTPCLAKAPPKVSADGLTFTYEIHPDAAWEDGSPITAEDVVFSFKAILCPLLTVKDAQPVFEKVEDVRTYSNDPKKLSVVMKEKYILNQYIVQDLYIIDKRFFDPNGLLDNFTVKEITSSEDGLSQDPNMQAWANEFNDSKYSVNPEFLKGTSGPYKIVEWVPNQRIVLARRENYWGKNLKGNFHDQYPDQIIFKAIRDENSMELQIKQQEIDVATSLVSKSYVTLKENEGVTANYKLDFQSRNGYAILVYNCRPDGVKHKPVLSDRLVRHALNRTVPVEDIIRDFYYGMGRRVTSPIPLESKEYNQSLVPIPYSPDSARALLDQAGWVDSDNDLIRDKVVNGEKIPLEMKITYQANRQSVADQVRRIIDEAKKVGIKLLPDPVDITKIQSLLVSRDFDIILTGFSGTVTPYDFKQLWSTSGESNYPGFGNAESDELIEKARVELNFRRRKPMVDKLQQIIYDEQPGCFMLNASNKMAVHRKFKNAKLTILRPYIMLNTLELNPEWEPVPVEATPEPVSNN